jgi:hypothetical protein
MRRACVAAVGVVLVLVGARVGLAAVSAVSVGVPFTLLSRVQSDAGTGASVPGSDGTIWLAQPVGDGSFRIVGRAASGRRMRPLVVGGGSGWATSTPAITESDGTATVVWETAGGDDAGVVYVRALRCRLSGCTSTQTLSSWHWTYANDPFPPMGYWAQPAVASASGHAVAVFDRDSANDPQMTWTQTNGTSFGKLHAFGGGASSAPVAVGESDDRVLVAWLDTDGESVDWAQWSAGSGFTAPRRLRDGEGFYAADLVAAAAGDGSAIAWIQGGNTTDPGLDSEPVWVVRQTANGFATPKRVFAGDAFGLSLASDDGVLALGFTTTRAGLDAGTPGPAVVEIRTNAGPFGAPITLDADAMSSPAVSVDERGDVLANWDANSESEIAVAPARQAFSPPTTIGPEASNDSPTIHTNGERSVVVWQNPAGSIQAALTTP